MTTPYNDDFQLEIQRFSQRLLGVPELPMRVALWRELFDSAHPSCVLAVVRATLDSLPQKRDWARFAMLALARFISDDRAYVRKVLLPAAVVNGATEVMALLATDAPSRIPESDELRPPQLLRDREVTLGERRAMARSRDRHVLERLLADPDPIVIDHVLINPKVIERDVLAIASRRPTSSDVLIAVFTSDRWIRLRSVQLALIQNPYCPVDIAIALVGLVDEDGLRQVVAARAVHALVRSIARGRLRGTASTDRAPILIDAEQIEWIEDVLNSRNEDTNSGD